ncbi:hypothetical protein TWF569_010415 [Orbilia oligospora]|uniref:Uncharacterized protein n=1 Tax=Orbilia oligospora TaxID=2813651 RepID=A0A7C8JII7_ORBOL|nr:hypothetical protein TWF706_006177 [Orbilia oligospora]KAF3126235.1 hypothetical protein TWF703_010493 [Orbilia oligospora]KAF3133728.1 hypothetical protein TWF569_010415 [Orbilia oligospora]KAF3147462.1 hypothetical protein TWF594_002681 [Orbilia oligospora]
MEGATHLYAIPTDERRPTDGRYIRLPLPTDGPFYPLSTLILPRIPRQPTNAYFSAPYNSHHELREIDIIHLSSTILSTIIYMTSTLLYTNDMEEWSLFQRVWLCGMVMGFYSFLYRWGYFYFSFWVAGFEWHLERPLWGVGGVEHFGLMAFWRLWIWGKGVFWDRFRAFWRKKEKKKERNEYLGYGYRCEEGCEECGSELGDGLRILQEDEDAEEEAEEGEDEDTSESEPGEEMELLMGPRRRRSSIVGFGFEKYRRV